MKHVMVDLETLDSAPTAAIVSIGAVVMDLDKFTLGEEFYSVVDPASSQGLGLTIGADTVRWWLQQSPEALAMFRSVAQKVDTLPVSLQRFTCWARENEFLKEDLAIWGNGATFDNVILRNAYKACGLKAPWSYRHDFCYRTMYRNFPSSEKYVKEGVAHNALDDARSQARALVEIMSRLKGVNSVHTNAVAE